MTKELPKRRSVCMTPKLNNDLEELCEHLGVNCHSYMVNEIAKSVQRDRMALISQNSIATMLSDFQRLANQE
jgi:hypothetical protein